MGTRGPKPLPTSIKKKKGTFQACRSAKDEYSPKTFTELPKPPVFLNKWAKSEYMTVGNILIQDNLLATIDLSLFITYCQQMGVYYESQQTLKKEGRIIETKSGYKQPHPAVSDGNTALGQAMKIAASFGITPSARTRVSAEKTEKKDEGNPILKLVPLKKAKNG